MARRILRKKQIEPVLGDSASPEDEEKDFVLDNVEQTPSGSNRDQKARTHDSGSAIWREHSIDGVSHVSSAAGTKDGDLDSDVISSGDEADKTLERKQLGGIEEIEIERDTYLNEQLYTDAKLGKGKRRIKKSNRKAKSETSKLVDIAWHSTERSESTKHLIGSSDESSISPSNNGSEFEYVLYTESESSKKRNSDQLLDGNDVVKKETKDKLDRKKKETPKAEISESRSEPERKFPTPQETSSDVSSPRLAEQNEPKTLLWQQAPRELQGISVDDSERIRTRPASSFYEHIRVFKPPKLRQPKQTGDKSTRQSIVKLRRPQSFCQIAAEIPPEKPSKYDLTAGTIFIADKPRKFPPVISTMHANNVTSQSRHVRAAHSMTSLHGVYSDNAPISRYTVEGTPSLPQELKVVEVPAELQRSTLRKARNAVEMAISNFQILFDNGAAHFQPGMPVTGKVIMDVWSTVEIRYVEFVLQGKATVRIFGQDGKFLNKPHSEMYLEKRIILLSPSAGEDYMILTPGKYVSEFAYKLPDNLPASVQQTEVSDSCVFSVAYSASANVCDFLHARHVPQSYRYAQVVKTCRRQFTILPQYDYRCLPGAMDPISHAEQFNVSCSPLSMGHTSVLVKLDHQLFALGDVMNLSLEVCTPDTKRIKDITANMVQTVIFQHPVSRKFKRTVIKAVDIQRKHKARRGANNTRSKNVYRCSFGIPIPSNLIPSLLLYAHIIQVNYSMDIKVSFKSLGGSLRMTIPVVLTSAMEAETAASAPSVPVFNKPVMQFPYFSRGPLRDSMKSLTSVSSTGSKDSVKANGTLQQHTIQQKHERVRAKYIHCLSF